MQASEPFFTITYVAVFGAQFLFAAVACVMIYRERARNEKQSMDSFVTARRSVGLFRIAWSFFSGSMGAWVITAIPSYSFAGILGLSVYAVCCGMPVVIIAYFGEALRSRFPGVMSSSDFCRWRYGPLCQVLNMLITLFNMSIAMLVEYVSMGSLFSYMVGSVSWGVIVYSGILTMAYTTWGGLRISIITDSFQGAASVTLAIILLVYVAVTYRGNFPTPIASQESCPYYNDPKNPCFPRYLIYGTPNMHDSDHVPYGLSSIATLPISLVTATLFSEAMWQRCWASVDRRTLICGSWLGCFGIITICGLSAVTGFLTAWQDSGLTHQYWNVGIPSPSVQFFYVLKDQLTFLPEFNAYTVQYVKSWIAVLVIVCAGVMSQGYVDALQTGFACTISSYFFRDKSINWARGVVVVINVVIMAVAATNPTLNVLLLFGITNIVCTCVAVPIMSGVFDPERKYINGDMVLFSSIFTIVGLSIFGVGYNWGTWDNDKSLEHGHSYTVAWGCPGVCSTSENIKNGLIWTWYLNSYDWKYYVVALVLSAVLLAIFVGMGQFATKVLGWPKGYTLEACIESYLTPLPSPSAAEMDAKKDGESCAPAEFTESPEESL